MTPEVLSVILLFSLFLLLGSGIWIALSLMGVGAIGMMLFSSAPIGKVMATAVFSSNNSWALTSLPLFIWMAEILFRTRLSEDMFSGLAPWLVRLPGRLLHVNVVGCGIFAAVSGSSAATCVTIGKMSMPELMRRGYNEQMSIGSLAGSGTLGLLIPPSIMMIVYGLVAEVSIARLFIAGVLPGIMLMVLFMGYIIIWAWFNPTKVPPADIQMSFSEKIYNSRRLIPVVLLIVAVIGSIYAGYATPTEAAAVGVLGSIGIAIATGTFTWKNFADSVMGATRTSCMITLILAGAAFLAVAMGFTGLPRQVAGWIASMQLVGLHAAVCPADPLHHPGLLPRRHIDGRAHHVSHPAAGDSGGHRCGLVRDLHRSGGGDGADHAAGGFQPVRPTRHDGEEHLLRCEGGVPVLPDHDTSPWS